MSGYPGVYQVESSTGREEGCASLDSNNDVNDDVGGDHDHDDDSVDDVYCMCFDLEDLRDSRKSTPVLTAQHV